ncbi:type II toxin-antitoxin system death-on-curing family toxin [Streptomyces sp. Amel2xC10]|uniref:type II toxin-antitoxin system death-on-curing family toxin n=1 Tax=Streptomyces sp. Amel2xC10 TaxID=1305826 RepID=UPI000A090D52|nr:type II toxin-antitoxin system death-on-curing family toxin [Streptomyces sp. Amel2xC10]SMF08519.1 death on curing protein [Streptomyces sp. Amel2xC10]
MAATRYLTVAEVTDIARIAFSGPDDPQKTAPETRAPETRSPSLLASAVHRPRARMFGTAAYTDPYEQAAALLHALATNHPLVDGNKRAAWLAAATFLALHGTDLAACDQDAAYDLVIDVASGAESEIAVIAARLRAL